MTIYGFKRDQEDVPIHLEWLHPLEIEYHGTLKFEKRRNDWLLGRWTSKLLLQQVLFPEAALNKIEIRKGPNREPLVYYREHPVSSRLSISHSHGRAFCVLVKEDMRMGCDLEKVENRNESFIRDYFTNSERRSFGAHYHSLLGQDTFFTLLWSAKECVMKACLTGLSIPPKDLELKQISDIRQGDWAEIFLQNLRNGSRFSGLFRLEEGFVWVVLTEDENMDQNMIDLVCLE